MAMTLITTNTSSNAASSSFTSGIDNTYKLYIFKFYAVNPASDMVHFSFNGSDDASSWSYDIVKTTTWFKADGSEAGDVGTIGYHESADLAQSADYQSITNYQGNDADGSAAGDLFLFNPSNTTYVKHFYSTCQHFAEHDPSQRATNAFTAGYFNTTAAITAIDFKMSSGNMDAVIKMYGVG
jgi:hypothetical protein